MTREQLRDTADYNSLSRDQLRQEARRHSIRVETTHGSYLPVWEAGKSDLVRAFTKARDTGKFGVVRTAPSGTDSPNVTVKQRSVVVFLKGTGCRGSSASVAATVEGDSIVFYPEVGPNDWDDDDLDSYEQFTTTADDLRAMLKALGV